LLKILAGWAKRQLLERLCVPSIENSTRHQGAEKPGSFWPPDLLQSAKYLSSVRGDAAILPI
jgi:hypothetical protein